MSSVLRLPAPAKLNLMLRIVGRREDGYHLLQTVFQFVDYSDWIGFELTGDGQVTLSQPLRGIEPERDLTVRAARLLQREAGVTEAGVILSVEKHLPMGGGLGGGSSDAATVLLGLNRLWGLGFPLDRLAQLGLSLGADVPVFVNGFAAWAEGVGEHLTPMPDLPEPWYVVVVPSCQVSTAEIFNAEGLTRDNEPITMRDFLAGCHENHCLPVVRTLYPEVAEAMALLESLGGTARLTGTGACVFSAFSERDEAERVAEGLHQRFRVFVARGLNRSPTHLALSGD